MQSNKITLILIQLLILSVTIFAQVNETDTAVLPEGFAEKYYEYLLTNNFESASKMYNPEVVNNFYECTQRLYKTTTKEMELTTLIEILQGFEEKEQLLTLNGNETFGALLNGLYKIQPELKEIYNSNGYYVVGNIKEEPETFCVVIKMLYNTDEMLLEKYEVVAVEKVGSELYILPESNLDFVLHYINKLVAE